MHQHVSTCTKSVELKFEESWNWYNPAAWQAIGHKGFATGASFGMSFLKWPNHNSTSVRPSLHCPSKRWSMSLCQVMSSLYIHAAFLRPSMGADSDTLRFGNTTTASRNAVTYQIQSPTDTRHPRLELDETLWGCRQKWTPILVASVWHVYWGYFAPWLFERLLSLLLVKSVVVVNIFWPIEMSFLAQAWLTLHNHCLTQFVWHHLALLLTSTGRH